MATESAPINQVENGIAWGGIIGGIFAAVIGGLALASSLANGVDPGRGVGGMMLGSFIGFPVGAGLGALVAARILRRNHAAHPQVTEEPLAATSPRESPVRMALRFAGPVLLVVAVIAGFVNDYFIFIFLILMPVAWVVCLVGALSCFKAKQKNWVSVAGLLLNSWGLVSGLCMVAAILTML